MWEVIGDFICGWGGTILACAGVLVLGVLAWIGAGQIGDGTSPSPSAIRLTPPPEEEAKKGKDGNGGDGE